MSPRNKQKTTIKKKTTAVRKKAPAKRMTAAKTDRTTADQRISELTEANRQLKRKIFDLYTIFEISRNFNAVLEFQTLLDTFILTSMGQVGASKGMIFLREHLHSARLELVKKRGAGEFPKLNHRFNSKSKLGVYLTKLNRPVRTTEIIDNLANRTERNILKLVHPGLVIPLIYQTELAGLLFITDKISGREFSLDDIEFLSILGSQISVAIENARLYEAEKEAQENLRAAQEQLVDSERLAALGEMSAKVAHEINNPLGIIKNYILLLKRASESNTEAGGYADIVGQEIDRIARIVRELLEFHRPQKLEFKKVLIADLIEDVLSLMERKLTDANIEVERNFCDKLPVVDAAPESLKQVFMNIVLNASDAMDSGGTLRIRLETQDDHVMIAICDTGPGIPDDIISRIFEPFFTTKDPGKGTGLGLSVCYSIIKQHQGTITYNNLKPGGCFEITFPVKRTNGQES